MKKSNWVFLMIMLLSTMITLSASNWISMWIGLELNMMSFIPLILKESNKSSTEAAMMYFLIQSMSSMLLISMVLINMMKFIIPNYLIYVTITISLLIKLGAAPFHMWVPEIMSKINWIKCAMLMTWQKMAPLMMMSNINNNSYIMNISIMMSAMVGAVGGMNQISLRKMMGFSSINHLGWIMAINKKMNLWMIYMFIYSIMVIMLCKLFNMYKMYFINQVNSINLTNTEKFNMFMMMMSMGGLPPFIGFLPKWMTIKNMIDEKELYVIIWLVGFSLLTLMYYMRTMTNMFLSFSSSTKWMMSDNKNFITSVSMIINLSMPIMLLFDMI
uniref:NADH dehydrogenase subunit 2 n=1 Tax=Sciocoris lateralis TaxID=2984290 RepID=UPI0023D7CC73|nr:NADH dehydrogenase subunit 2 [Sciocoris lateralis]WCQ78554.1 NADH dehydrogenase subunit 2 [Sciocoris lateralis]